MKYLINTQETWHAETEQEAVELIEEAKKTNPGNLLKYSSQHKEKYNKDGEQIYDYYKVTLNKTFNIEKEPDTIIDIDYSFHKQEKPLEVNDYESF